jgi:hypothetical protein
MSKNVESQFKPKQDERNFMLVNLLDGININNLGQFYPKDESVFKKKIDKLNYRFYLETEKFLNNKTESEKCQDQLFMILFKQISLYVQEIERLNIILREKIEFERVNKDKCDDIFRKEKECNSMQMLINNLRVTNKNLEKRLNDKIITEEKQKNEITSMERQIKFYKEKMQIELMIKKTHEMNKNRVTKRYPPEENLNETSSHLDTGTNISTEDLSKTFNKKRNNSDNNNTDSTASLKKSVILASEAKREITKSNNLPKNIVIDLKTKKQTSNSDTKGTITRKPILTAGKDFKIIKSVKQGTHKLKPGIKYLTLEDLTTPACTKFLNLEISNINNSNINFNLDNSYLHELILSNYNTFDEEYQELAQLEEMLLKGKKFLEDENRKSDSVEICNSNLSDLEDGYKSSGCLSDNAVSFKKKKIEKGITSVTIDLIKNEKNKLNCFKTKKSVNEKIS